MAHFARIENNVVSAVIVVDNGLLLDDNGIEQESLGVSFCQSLFGDTTEWLQTSYNNNLRKNFASVGFTYDLNRDAFIAPQPFPSWVLNETSCNWEPPIPYPDDDNYYSWDESNTSWLQVDIGA